MQTLFPHSSCAPNPLKCGGTGGCYGSVESLAYTYASLFGLVTEEEYPYENYWGADNETVCTFNGTETDVSVMTMGWETLPHNDMLAMMDHLANKGPLSVGVDASNWQLYTGGMFEYILLVPNF